MDPLAAFSEPTRAWFRAAYPEPTAVQAGTANFLDPSAAQTIAQGMEQWLLENNVADIRELIGALKS